MRAALVISLSITGCNDPQHDAVTRRAAAAFGLEIPTRSQTERQIDRIASKVRAGGSNLEALNRVVFDDLGFVREVDQDEARFLLLPNVLQERRGSCVGLAQLYVTVGKRLGLPLRPVLVPKHLFVRAGSRNVELLRRGEAMQDSWYAERYAPPPNVPAYLRPLTDDELSAVVQYNLGNLYRRERNLREALAHYTRAAGLFPGFPEAHASRGLVLHLIGDLPAAERAYRRAAELYPSLPDLRENRAELTRETRDTYQFP